MAISPTITTAIISVLIASFQTSITINDGIFSSTPAYIKISDDATYGTLPSVNPSFDQIYQQIRYEVFNNALQKYLKTISTTSLLGTSVRNYVNSTGIKNLCNAYAVPILIRKTSPTDYPAQLKSYQTYVSNEITTAKNTWGFKGKSFTDEIDHHISSHLLNFLGVWDNPKSMMSTAYSSPNWGSVGTLAADACGNALIAMKK